MFFRKKTKYLNLNHTQLATALQYQSKCDFNKNNNSFYDRNYGYIYDVISIDEHIDITIYHLNKIDSWDTNFYINCIFMETYMYVDGIKVNHYKFEKQLKKGCGTTNIWILEYKKIYHKIPNEIIQKINDWSNHVVSTQKKKETIIINDKQKREEKREEAQHHLEELKLQETYKNYKGG